MDHPTSTEGQRAMIPFPKLRPSGGDFQAPSAMFYLITHKIRAEQKPKAICDRGASDKCEVEGHRQANMSKDGSQEGDRQWGDIVHGPQRAVA